MTPSPVSSASVSPRKLIDMLLGAVVMGTVGALIGMLMGEELIAVAIGIGAAMGTVIGMFGGRRFLISIVLGALAGGALAWFVAGTDKISFGAGAGAAMGGFLGVQSSMLLDLWAEHKRTAGVKESQE
ncbi:MAG TPA: hypothetical protein VFI05_04440 [Nitrospiraceae bacterium]|nr:hypothetical protein [Nitrospiraceae bacterium]